MRSIQIDKKHNGKKLEKALRDQFPIMPVSALYKAFRKKDIKVNGVRVKEDHVVYTGDTVEVYITDNILDGKPVKTPYEKSNGFKVVFEDQNLLIVNKEQGIPVHADKDQQTDTLIDRVRSYLDSNTEYSTNKSRKFQPSLCHRLDRNTGGLVIIAKNQESLDIILNKIKHREIKKYYQCLVQGHVDEGSSELKAYLFKDEKKNQVFIYETPRKHSLEIITRYKVLSYEKEYTRLEVELVTGRTHQIRAHLAFIGHPILGDGKYGSNSFNRAMGAKRQALWAYKLRFDFNDGGILDYLKGRTFCVEPEFPKNV